MRVQIMLDQLTGAVERARSCSAVVVLRRSAVIQLISEVGPKVLEAHVADVVLTEAGYML
jgi:hypothetical protein